jgi:glycosyltransferase involved in cell wall biosynthesis
MGQAVLRVLLATHHYLDPDTQGVTLALGHALETVGCAVEHASYDDFFPEVPESVWHLFRFPWVLAAHLARRACAYDVIDVTTGDNWPWALAGRPGAAPRHALVTRSHGLEHTYSDRLREDARQGGLRLSWKYPVYHGGYRLWEVRQSLRLADHSIMLNAVDAVYARDVLRVADSRLSIIPNGLTSAFHALPPPRPHRDGEPLGLAFIGNWLRPKGSDEVVACATRLHAEGVPFTLTLLGTGSTAEAVRAAFPQEVRDQVRVIPRFPNADLPRLLQGCEVLVFPTHSEGYGLALVEAMACGLVPVVTPVGVAPEVVHSGETGVLVPIGNVVAIVDAVRALAKDPPRRLSLRRAAQAAVQGLSWANIAARTVALYERVLRERSRR